MRRALTVLAVACAAVFSAAMADPPMDQLSDPAEEARARELFDEIRCVVCQNESIAGSEADLAYDMRMLVRERVEGGDTDQEVRDFLYARYGDFILLRPRFSPKNLVLWVVPFLIVLVGVGLLALRRSRPSPLEESLSDEELSELKRLDINPDGKQ